MISLLELQRRDAGFLVYRLLHGGATYLYVCDGREEGMEQEGGRRGDFSVCVLFDTIRYDTTIPDSGGTRTMREC